MKLNKDFIHYFSLLGYLGFIMIGNIGLCVILYKVIEKYLFKSTVLFITLLLIGVVSGFYSIYKVIMRK